MVVGLIGIAIMLEATRRAMGTAMLITTGVFLAYIFAGPYMPEVIQHKGASLSRMVSHMWLTTEGVYGVALGVSVQFIFLFVLFGTLLDIAGAGNYMMQVSTALLGHLRGGPAKVAVLSSALNGVVSGSSVSNVVSGGIFTIPMMKRTGYSGVKAGAIEAASSIDGQHAARHGRGGVPHGGVRWHPVLGDHQARGAAGHHLLRGALLHRPPGSAQVRPEADPAPRPPRRRQRLIEGALGAAGTLVAVVIYYVVTGVQRVFGESAGWALAILTAGGYLGLLAFSARFPDLSMDDPSAPVIRLPELWPTVRAGLHFLVPLVVLLWCLMVEELFPGLSAFWATATVMATVVIQPPLLALLRRQGAVRAALRRGLDDLWKGLVLGARNMIGIGVATASAGLIVGAITLAGGLGFRVVTKLWSTSRAGTCW